MIIRDKVIVLKNQDFSESDLIIRGLNSNGRQLSFIAKGAVKSKKRFSGGVLEPTSYIELEYKTSKNSLHKLQQAWFLKDFSELRKDYNCLNLAFYFLKVSSQVSREGEEDDTKELFHLLGNSLVSAQTSLSLNSLKIFFQIKILFLQGILPTEYKFKNILKSTLQEHTKFNMDETHKHILIKQLDQILQNYLDR